MESKQEKIFKNGSKTFFYSTFFFPETAKQDITVLYAFVRTADDFVDATPSDSVSFYDFKNKYIKAIGGEKINYEIIDDFVLLQKKYDFEQEWIDAFFFAMESDLHSQYCKNITDTEKYMYGSAEVIGLMMCKILNIKEEAYVYARKLGQAFQYINFIRDLYEDEKLGRLYLPEENILASGMPKLSFEVVEKNKLSFENFMRQEIKYFYRLVNEASPGFNFIPRRYRIPIVIATNLYIYTAKIIESNPYIVYQQKVKPNKSRIFYEALKVIIKI